MGAVEPIEGGDKSPKVQAHKTLVNPKKPLG